MEPQIFWRLILVIRLVAFVRFFDLLFDQGFCARSDYFGLLLVFWTINQGDLAQKLGAVFTSIFFADFYSKMLFAYLLELLNVFV